MDAIENIKDVLKLAQTVGNADLYQKLNAVQIDFLELSEKVRQLQDENREFREKLRQKERMGELLAKRTHQHNAYGVDDEGPYCTACWDNKDKAVRMTAHPGTEYAVCPVCKNEVCYDPAARDRHHRYYCSRRRDPSSRRELLSSRPLVLQR
ncbi:MAG: hypothetical protein ACE5I3_03140 [Phycisphaerae bacterium]